MYAHLITEHRHYQLNNRIIYAFSLVHLYIIFAVAMHGYAYFYQQLYLNIEMALEINFHGKHFYNSKLQLSNVQETSAA